MKPKKKRFMVDGWPPEKPVTPLLVYHLGQYLWCNVKKKSICVNFRVDTGEKGALAATLPTRARLFFTLKFARASTKRGTLRNTERTMALFYIQRIRREGYLLRIKWKKAAAAIRNLPHHFRHAEGGSAPTWTRFVLSLWGTMRYPIAFMCVAPV